jgi:hypothetical protein
VCSCHLPSTRTDVYVCPPCHEKTGRKSVSECPDSHTSQHRAVFRKQSLPFPSCFLSLVEQSFYVVHSMNLLLTSGVCRVIKARASCCPSSGDRSAVGNVFACAVVNTVAVDYGTGT